MPGDTCVFLGVHTRVHMGVHAVVCTGGCETLPGGRTSPDGLWHRIVSPPFPALCPGTGLCHRCAPPPPLPCAPSRSDPIAACRGAVRVDIELRDVGIDQCDSGTGWFAGTHRCDLNSTQVPTPHRSQHPPDPSTQPPHFPAPPPHLLEPRRIRPFAQWGCPAPFQPPPPRPTVPSARPSGLIRPPRPHLPLPHRSAVYCANLPPSAAPWGDPAATRVGTAGTDGRSGASPGGLALPPSPRPAAPPAGQGSGRTRRG